MSLTMIVPYSVALSIMAAIPGPGITALVGNALASGFRATVPMALGLILGDLTFMTAVVLGLALLLGTFTTAFLILKLVSVAYILFLAWKLYRRDFVMGRIVGAPSITPGAAFTSGYLVTLSNPKAMIFYVSLLPSLLPLDHVTFEDYLLMAAVTACVLALTILPYITLASKLGAVITNPLHWKLLRLVAVAAMIGAAFMVFLQLF